MWSNIAGENSTSSTGSYYTYAKSRWKECPPSPQQSCRAKYGKKNMQSSQNLTQWKVPVPAWTIGALEGKDALFLFRGKRGTVQMGKTQLQQFVSGNNRFTPGWKAPWGVSAVSRLELTLSLQQPQDSAPVWKCSWCSHMGFSCWQRNSHLLQKSPLSFLSHFSVLRGELLI